MDGYTQRVHARIQVDAAYDFLANGAGVVRSVSLDSLTRFDARNTSSDVASFNSTTRAIRNASGQSRTVRVVSKPDWLTTEFYEGDGAPSGAPVSQTALTLISDGQLRLRVNGIGLSDGFNKGELVLSVDGSSTRIRLKVTALVTTPVELDYETVRFGPFEWVGDADESVGSIFRLVGLDSGLPVALSADIERWGARDGRTVTDASIQCDSEHRSMYSYVRLSIDRCTLRRLSIDRVQLLVCTATRSYTRIERRVHTPLSSACSTTTYQPV